MNENMKKRKEFFSCQVLKSAVNNITRWKGLPSWITTADCV